MDKPSVHKITREYLLEQKTIQSVMKALYFNGYPDKDIESLKKAIYIRRHTRFGRNWGTVNLEYVVDFLFLSELEKDEILHRQQRRTFAEYDKVFDKVREGFKPSYKYKTAEEFAAYASEKEILEY